MANRRKAKVAARSKARRVYRSLIRKPKRAVAKIAANFIGKTTYKTVASKSRRYGKKRGYGRKTKRYGRRSYRRY